MIAARFRSGRDLIRAETERAWRARRRSFVFGGECYRYHSHRYNTTWRNERTVELPIVLRFLDRHRGSVLEVGNVLSHYGVTSHDVVDKYERGPEIVNVDVVDFQPTSRYAAIVAISTLEHIGFDEETPDPDKPVRALELMVSWLQPGGGLLVTVPLGYNVALDERLFSGALRFDELHFMHRLSADNRWCEATATQVHSARYATPFRCANAVAIGARRG